MGFRERQHEKVHQRAAEFLQSRLLPGEQIRGVTFGQARPRRWPGLELLLGPLVVLFATTYYYMVLTDQRLSMLKVPKGRSQPSEVVWAEQHAGIAIERFKQGRLWMLLYMRRIADGQVIRFRAQRSSPGAAQRVSEAAEALRQARAGLPGG
jgi:hypothetical protein